MMIDGCVPTVLLLCRTSGELLQEYKGHTCKSFKMDCCLTNSDAYVIGGSEDSYLFIWDLVDASVVLKSRAHLYIYVLSSCRVATVIIYVNMHQRHTSNLVALICLGKVA